MRILAVDTSSLSGSLALLDGENIIAEWTIRSAHTHNRRLLKAVDTLIREAGWDLNSIDGFAVASGPGSFTGLRIGMTTLKLLAWTLAKPYAAISSLDALAFPLSFAAFPVCSVIDARKDEVYCALYQSDDGGTQQIVMPHTVISAAGLAAKIKQKTIFVGDGWLLYKNQIREILGSMALEASPTHHILRASSVGELARGKFLLGESDDPATSLPLYIRPSEAEIRYPHLAEKSSGKSEINQNKSA
jgi:tRNA threonylcarbamoyladenosine biosynthesis protein TsaB